MPVARYFLFVGAALLALLLALDGFMPQQVAVANNDAPSIDKTVVRIHSDRKLPERVVYDTSLPTIVPPASKTRIAVAPAAPVADPAAQARVRNSFAQLVPGEAKNEVKKPETRIEPQAPRKRRIAKLRPAPAEPMRFAQQQHFGFFGNTWNSGWNSTW
jgi:hypothetical protein